MRALVDEHVAPGRLALCSWMATNELLIERQWRIAQARRDLRGRGAAHEARYTALIRARFAATDERSHLPIVTGARAEDERAQPMSWWRTWHDRGEPSLPRLVFESDDRTRRRVEDDHHARLRERLAGMAAAEANLRGRLGIPSPPRASRRRLGASPSRQTARPPDP